MDLAAPEMVRVAKEAYTYEYELQLRKEQNEGDLNKDLASLNETLSSIQAEIATFQAQMDTALERETNRARALARQRFVEAESTANANAALLEAQALDIRAMSAAQAPEILDYRYQQDMLSKLESLAGSLPQIVQVGGEGSDGVDFLRIAQQVVGGTDAQLFSDEELSQIRAREEEISRRVASREDEIAELLEEEERTVAAPTVEPDESLPGADRVEEIRRSVSSESVDLPSESTPRQDSSESAPGSSAYDARTDPEKPPPGYDGPTNPDDGATHGEGLR
jgi:hypothetical protein